MGGGTQVRGCGTVDTCVLSSKSSTEHSRFQEATVDLPTLEKQRLETLQESQGRTKTQDSEMSLGSFCCLPSRKVARLQATKSLDSWALLARLDLIYSRYEQIDFSIVHIRDHDPRSGRLGLFLHRAVP